jgi:hypothetical protein
MMPRGFLFLDSLLIYLTQVKGTWRSKNQKMTELCNEVRGLQANFVSFEMNNVGQVS